MRRADAMVSLVGAGPGDPELITVGGADRLARADCIIYDRLANPALLRRARVDAELIYAGKLPDRHTLTQDEINALLVEKGRAGLRVVRLKGGDPFVFGRGGEEAEHLRAAGIAVQVINGISSGLAAATALGVPWTHRDHAHGVLLVTGHAGEANAELHWPTLGAAAAQGLTLVVYMAMQRLAVVQAGLATTLSADTPAALVQNASTGEERRLLSTLGCLVEDAAASQMRSPAILIVGNVLAACRNLDRSATAAAPGGEPQVRCLPGSGT